MPFVIIKLVGSEYRKKRENTQPVISEQENDALRVLAKIIARRHIRNQLDKVEDPIGKDNINNNKDSKTSNG